MICYINVHPRSWRPESYVNINGRDLRFVRPGSGAKRDVGK